MDGRVTLEDESVSEDAGPREVVVRGGALGFAQEIAAGPHRLAADEPMAVGGTDTGIAFYARRKRWPLEKVTVRLRHGKIHPADCADCETREGIIDRIDCDIQLAGSLTEEQRSKLLEIAGKCPVHRTLKSEIDIRTRLTA